MEYIPKVGDIVTIRDGSYMYCEDTRGHNGRFSSTSTIGWCKDEFIVKTIGGIFPITGARPERPYNNTRIQNLVNGESWFCIATVSLSCVRQGTASTKSALKFKELKKFSL